MRPYAAGAANDEYFFILKKSTPHSSNINISVLFYLKDLTHCVKLKDVMNQTDSLVISFIFNIFLVGLMMYTKKDIIEQKFSTLKAALYNIQHKAKADRTNEPVIIEGDMIDAHNSKLVRILIIGNSITYHQKTDSVGWKLNNGMAASSLKNDYAHLLLKKIHTKKKVNIKFMIVNLGDFEKSYRSFDIKKIDKLKSFNPDIAIFQFGENVEREIKKIRDFESYYEKLVRNFADSQIIITTSFSPSREKNELSQKVALSTNSYLVDLSHLALLDELNYAKNEKDHPYEHPAIGYHPGNFGMSNIAMAIFTAVNPLIK